MSSWADLDAAYNRAALPIFGDPIIYQDPDGDPVSVSTRGTPLMGIRLQRSPEEFVQSGTFEGISVNWPDFPSPPQLGSWVTLGSVQYVISEIRDPDPFDNTKTLILNRRKPLDA